MILYGVIFFLLIIIHLGMARKRRRGYGRDADKKLVKECANALTYALQKSKQAKDQLSCFEYKYDERERHWAEQAHAKYEADVKVRDTLHLQYASAKDSNDRGELEDAVLYLIELDLINQTSLVAGASQEPLALHRNQRSDEHGNLKALHESALANVVVAEANVIKANDRNLPKVCDLYIDRSEKRIRAYEDRCLVFKRRITDARDAALAKRQRGSQPNVEAVIPNAIFDRSANTESAFNVTSESVGQAGIIMGTNDSSKASSQSRVEFDPAGVVSEDRCSF